MPSPQGPGPSRGLHHRKASTSGSYGRALSTKNLYYMVQEWAGPSEIIVEEPQTSKTLNARELEEIKRSAREINFTDRDAERKLEDLLNDWKLSLKKGLSDQQVEELRGKHGKNELASDPPTPFWRLFLEQFEDILVLMLIGACIVSLALGQFAAGVAIILIVMFNAILGAVQEHGAGAALDALAALQVTTANVLRNGVVEPVEGPDIVPGDVVIIGTGDSVAADIRLTEVQDLEVNEASLTGEAEAVKKGLKSALMHQLDAKAEGENKEEETHDGLTLNNVLYMGTEITNGKGRGIVIHTGMGTKIGQLAERLKSVDAGQSPLKKKLGKLGLRLGLASLSVSILIFIIGVSTGRGADPTSADPLWLQMLLIAVSLTVAAVPEGLPVCVTISLAIGMQNMTKKNALVRKLASVETLGSTTIICTDKTGTLTCGKMTSVRLWRFRQLYRVTGQGYNPEGCIFPVDEKQQGGEIPEDAAAMFGKVKEKGYIGQILTAFLLCSDATVEKEEIISKDDRGNETKKMEWVGVGNATERALVVAARKLGIERKEISSAYEEVAQNPFSSKRKMMSVLIKVDADCKKNAPGIGVFQNLTTKPYIGVAKGAPNRIIERCTRMVVDNKIVDMKENDKAEALGAVNMLSSQALRVLAVGIRGFDDDSKTEHSDLEANLIFLGLNAAIDPERPEVTIAIARAKNAGVETVMITGDYLATAKAIAENIGLLPKGDSDNATKVMDCVKIRQLGADITSLKKQISEASDGKDEFKKQLKILHEKVDRMTSCTKVYARAEPFDKITIVESYQRQGHVACMTGDGVNDAAALQGANIGVAMGSGTDVAKGAADMVLLDDSFATIVAAIEEGRKIYANITKFVFFLLSTNVAEVFLILLALLMGLQVPLVPIQILWLNLVTDGAPAVALAMELAEPGIMDEGPRPLSEPILEKIQLTGIGIQTFFELGLTLGAYIIGLQWNTGSWDGQNDDKDDNELRDGIRKAQTIVIYLIVFLELLRAYTSRALRTSVFSMGVFSNTFMQYAVIFSVALTVFVGNVPVLQDIFSMRYLDGREWGLIIGFTPIPSIVDELTKVVYRYTGFGERPKAISKDSETDATTDDVMTGIIIDAKQPNAGRETPKEIKSLREASNLPLQDLSNRNANDSVIPPSPQNKN